MISEDSRTTPNVVSASRGFTGSFEDSGVLTSIPAKARNQADLIRALLASQKRGFPSGRNYD
jgi:hypothetical protein